MSNHHRKPKSRGGDNSARNISKVSKVQHRAWHVLFSNMTPEQIADEINEKWIDQDYKMIFIKR